MSRTPMSRRFHRALRSPAEFTKRGWREVLTRTGQAMSAHNMPIVAAGIAFYMVWALFPALVALVLLGITVLGEQEMLHLLSRIRVDLPSSVDAVVGAQLSAIARQSRAFSSSAFIGSVAVALWGAMRGARGLIEAMMRFYEDTDGNVESHPSATGDEVFRASPGAGLRLRLSGWRLPDHCDQSHRRSASLPFRIGWRYRVHPARTLAVADSHRRADELSCNRVSLWTGAAQGQMALG